MNLVHNAFCYLEICPLLCLVGVHIQCIWQHNMINQLSMHYKPRKSIKQTPILLGVRQVRISLPSRKGLSIGTLLSSLKWSTSIAKKSMPFSEVLFEDSPTHQS